MIFVICLSYKPSLQVCNPAHLVPVSSQDKLGGLQQEGYPALKWGDDGGGGIDGPYVVASSRIVGALASIFFPTLHKIQNDDRLPEHISGVSVWMSLLVPAYLGSHGQRTVKWQCVCECVCIYPPTLLPTLLLLKFYPFFPFFTISTRKKPKTTKLFQ